MIKKLLICGVITTMVVGIKKVNDNKKQWNRKIKAKNNERLNTLYIECINECEKRGFNIPDESIINAVIFEAENILLKRA